MVTGSKNLPLLQLNPRRNAGHKEIALPQAAEMVRQFDADAEWMKHLYEAELLDTAAAKWQRGATDGALWRTCKAPIVGESPFTVILYALCLPGMGHAARAQYMGQYGRENPMRW